MKTVFEIITNTIHTYMGACMYVCTYVCMYVYLMLMGQAVGPLNMEPVGCLEKLATNYQTMLHNNPEGRR